MLFEACFFKASGLHFWWIWGPNLKENGSGVGTFWSLVFMPVLEALFSSVLDLFASMSVLRRCCFGCRTLCFLVCFWYGRFAGMLWKSSKPTSNTSQKSMGNRWKTIPKKLENMSFSWISVGTAGRTHVSLILEWFGHGCWMRWGAKIKKREATKSVKTRENNTFWVYFGVPCPRSVAAVKGGLYTFRPRAR